MQWGDWKTATLAYATDDDLTPAVDLEWEYEFLIVLIPTITSSTVTVHGSRDNTTFFPVYAFDADATGDFAHATTAATTSHAAIFHIGGLRHIKISTGSAQGADRVFYVRGYNR